MIGGGGAEGVARGEEDRLALILELLGELGDRGRLARPVDPGDQQDGWLGGGELDRVILLLDEAAGAGFAARVKPARERILEFCAALD